MIELGEFSLSLALAVTGYGLIAAILGYRQGSLSMVRSAENAALDERYGAGLIAEADYRDLRAARKATLAEVMRALKM